MALRKEFVIDSDVTLAQALANTSIPSHQLSLVTDNARYLVVESFHGDQPTHYFFIVLARLHMIIQMQFLALFPHLQLGSESLLGVLKNLKNTPDRLTIYQQYKSNIFKQRDKAKSATWVEILEKLPLAYRFSLATEILQARPNDVKPIDLMNALPTTDRHDFYLTQVTHKIKTINPAQYEEIAKIFDADWVNYDSQIVTENDFNVMLDLIKAIGYDAYNNRWSSIKLSTQKTAAVVNFIHRKISLTTQVGVLVKALKILGEFGVDSRTLCTLLCQNYAKFIQNAKDLRVVLTSLQEGSQYPGYFDSRQPCLSARHCAELVMQHFSKLKMKEYAEDIIVIIDNLPVCTGNDYWTKYNDEARISFVEKNIPLDVILTNANHLLYCIEHNFFNAKQIPSIIKQYQHVISSVHALVNCLKYLPKDEWIAFVTLHLKNIKLNMDDCVTLIDFLKAYPQATKLRLTIALDHIHLITTYNESQKLLNQFTDPVAVIQILTAAPLATVTKSELLKTLESTAPTSEKIKLLEVKGALLSGLQDMLDILIKFDRRERHVALIALKAVVGDQRDEILSLLIPGEYHQVCKDAVHVTADTFKMSDSEVCDRQDNPGLTPASIQ